MSRSNLVYFGIWCMICGDKIMYKILALLLLSYFSLFSVVSAGTIDPSNSDKQYLEYGAKHECVLPIMGVLGDELNSVFRGSCVIINENYVLTAAHVVSNSINQFVIYKGKTYPAAISAIHALYDPKTFGKHDIALVRLQRPIKLDFYPQLYEEQDENKKICSISGFGYYGDFKKGYGSKNFDNKRRAGSNVINRIRDNILICSIVDSPVTSLEFLICCGDSGGGLFIDNKLAGINSCVFSEDGKADSDYGDYSGHTRISDYHLWIKSTMVIIEKVFVKSD